MKPATSGRARTRQRPEAARRYRSGAFGRAVVVVSHKQRGRHEFGRGRRRRGFQVRRLQVQADDGVAGHAEYVAGGFRDREARDDTDVVIHIGRLMAASNQKGRMPPSATSADGTAGRR